MIPNTGDMIRDFERAVKAIAPNQHKFGLCNDHKTMAVYIPKDCFHLVDHLANTYLPGWKINLVEYKELDSVNHPAHYGGKDNTYEAIKVIEAWNLGFCLGNTVKYISRAGKKDSAKKIEDLEKARWYLVREIERLENDTRDSRVS